MKLPPLIGTREAAEIIGTSKQNLWNMYQRGKLPVTVAVISRHPIWIKADIERWAAHRRAAAERRKLLRERVLSQ